jgi:flagellar assembly protein FliH
MLQEARSQVDDLREDARQEGIEMGREEGIRQGQEEIDRMRAEMESERLDRKQEYDEMIRQTEGRYVDVLCSLLRKLSGEIVSDKRDVILHLIRSGIADMEPAKHYIIRVGNEDLLYVESKKDDIVERTGISATVEIQEEKDLERGECIIETDTQMIDCGFHTQLENLITTLRMLVQ